MIELRAKCIGCGKIVQKNYKNPKLIPNKPFVCDECFRNGINPIPSKPLKFKEKKSKKPIRERLENKFFNPSALEDSSKLKANTVYELARTLFLDRFGKEPSSEELEETARELVSMLEKPKRVKEIES